MKSKVVFILISIVFFITQSSCSTLQENQSTQHVGVFLPCSSPARWLTEGIEIRSILEDKGYAVELYYANKDSLIQKKQIEEAVRSGIDAMIVAAVTPKDIIKPLEFASSNNVKIIAYDRLLTNTESVSYFVGFDNFLIGEHQGTSLVEGLRSKGDGPYNIEIFAGCNQDGNAIYFYEGAMSIIRPLIKNGEINIVSNQVLFNDVCIENFCSNAASKRMEGLLSKYYSNGIVLNGVLSPSDSISIGLINVFDSTNSFSHDNYPVITGQNAEINNLIAITNSKQHSTIFKDSKLLAQMASSMIIAILNDEIPEINDSSSFHNGIKIVPTFLCEPVLITKDNYENILIETGHIRYEQIFPNE